MKFIELRIHKNMQKEVLHISIHNIFTNNYLFFEQFRFIEHKHAYVRERVSALHSRICARACQTMKHTISSTSPLRQ
jgi:hypothetical protein